MVLIAAVARNGVIGNAGSLPWHLPSDLKRFKQVTMGRPVIMGRKTWESIGKPLHGRLNIVVTRNPGFAPAGATVAGSLAQALEIAADMAPEADEVFVIGGGELYREAMPLAGRLYITEVAAEPEGDTRFPPISDTLWQAIHSETIERGGADTAGMHFLIYERRTGVR